MQQAVVPQIGITNVTASPMRWVVMGLMFTSTLINFLNRVTIAVLGPTIVANFHLNNTEFASLTSIFLVAYALSQAASGRLYDAVGTRKGFAVSVTLWSVSAMAQAFAPGLALLNLCRFMLGLGEGGNWPGAAKVVAEWLPARQRALGLGICNSGATLGALIAPPLLIWIQLRWGWQAGFIVVGALGLLWLVPWLILYRTPPATGDEHSGVVARGYDSPITWFSLLRYRQVWAIVLSRFIADPIWWLYVTWLPLYLVRVVHFSIRDIGLFAWIPFLGADLGSIGGGWLSGRLLAAGWSANRARKSVIVSGMLLMAAGVPMVWTRNAGLSLGCCALVLFGFQAWITNVQTLTSDWFPARSVGSVAGLGGLGAGIGAILFTELVGFTVDHFSYTPIFVAAAVMPVVATILLFSVGGRIQPVSIINATQGE